jgi:hypothetical protein
MTDDLEKQLSLIGLEYQSRGLEHEAGAIAKALNHIDFLTKRIDVATEALRAIGDSAENGRIRQTAKDALTSLTEGG